MDAGFGVLGSLLEEDRAELCGERYARSEQRRAYRHGYDEGSLVMGGRRVKVRKPRARSVDGPRSLIRATYRSRSLAVESCRCSTRALSNDSGSSESPMMVAI